MFIYFSGDGFRCSLFVCRAREAQWVRCRVGRTVSKVNMVVNVHRNHKAY